MKKEIEIVGMHCAACSSRVEAALNAIDGVKAKVDLKKGTALIKSKTEIDDIVLREAVQALGFEMK